MESIYVIVFITCFVYLILEPPNLPTLAEKIRRNIQFRSKNIIKTGAKK